jgi:hypothetical protein
MPMDGRIVFSRRSCGRRVPKLFLRRAPLRLRLVWYGSIFATEVSDNEALCQTELPAVQMVQEVERSVHEISNMEK